MDTSPLPDTVQSQSAAASAKLRKQIVRGGVGTLFIAFGSAALAFLSSVVLARALGATGFGVYSYVLALVSLLSLPAEFGLPKLVLRETARAERTESWALMRGMWTWAGRYTTTFSVGLIALGGLAVLVIPHAFTSTEVWTFGWGLVLVPFVALGMLRDSALRGLRRVVQGQLSETIVRPLALISLIVLGGALGYEINAASAMGMHVVAAGLAFLLGGFLLSRARPPQLASVTEPETRRKEWIAAILPLAFIEGMVLINKRADILLIGALASVDDVGVYRVVVQGATVVGLGLQTINRVASPYFARLHAAGETEQLQKMVTMTSRAVLLFTVPVVILVVLFGRDMLRIAFGPEFERGYWAFVLLATGQLISSAFGSVGYLLTMTGHERDTAKGIAVAAVSNVILNVALIPFFGLVGSAAATLLSVTIWNAFLYRSALLRTGLYCSVLGRPKRVAA